jgi:anti-sigma regulatory factor (Ser/Thr protein kinase)
LRYTQKCLDRSSPRARILRLLGEELISDEIIAVSELVKNAHDADARSCVIRFTSVTKPEGEIRIEDDGWGMSLDEFLGGWMQPGASDKRSADRHHTPRGRRVLGEKGVGRFAADKLTSRLEVRTRKHGMKGIQIKKDQKRCQGLFHGFFPIKIPSWFSSSSTCTPAAQRRCWRLGGFMAGEVPCLTRR